MLRTIAIVAAAGSAVGFGGNGPMLLGKMAASPLATPTGCALDQPCGDTTPSIRAGVAHTLEQVRAASHKTTTAAIKALDASGMFPAQHEHLLEHRTAFSAKLTSGDQPIRRQSKIPQISQAPLPYPGQVPSMTGGGGNQQVPSMPVSYPVPVSYPGSGGSGGQQVPTMPDYYDDTYPGNNNNNDYNNYDNNVNNQQVPGMLGGGGGQLYCPQGNLWNGRGRYCISNNIYFCNTAGEKAGSIAENCNNQGCSPQSSGDSARCIARNPTCPTGRVWGGPGTYCLQGDLWNCDQNGKGRQATSIVKNCASQGCTVAQAGESDYCTPATPAPTPSNNNNPRCPAGQYFIGNGGYCLENDVWFCDGAGSNARYLAAYCDHGCQYNANGFDSCVNNNNNNNNNNNPTCPSGSGWVGASTYCLAGDLWQCDYQPGSLATTLAQNCANQGCISAPTGYPDTCANNNNNNNNGLQNFQLFQGYAVKGNNDRVINRVATPEQCARECMNEQSFQCLSFELSPNDPAQQCVLSASVHPVISSPSWNLYIYQGYQTGSSSSY